ncbi:hypothetical protein BDL97_07G101600 [Sphagnum fallax]|nr:hypothetical protein BDL97_07G101600 [Sphagnum fallax]
MDVRREKSAVWGWRNFVAAACRRRRRRCCRLTPSPSSSSYLSAPEVFSLLAFNLRSRARAASSTAVRSFFRSFCRSFRSSRLRFWCSIIAVRFLLLAGPGAKFVWKTRKCLSWFKRSGKLEENFRRRRDDRLPSSCKFCSVPKYLK